MRIIIDGYNLLFSGTNFIDTIPTKPFTGFSKKSSVLEQARNTLISLIKAYAQSRKEYTTIIFDGVNAFAGVANNFSSVKTDYLIVLFSDKNSSADDLIIKIACDSVSESQVLVVTSDNDITQRVKQYGIKTVSSPDFMNMLISSSHKFRGSNKIDYIKDNKKLYGISPEETEKWMELFGFDSPDHPDITPGHSDEEDFSGNQ